LIDVKHEGDIANLTMAHGKANALDTEFCDALTAQFEKFRRGQGSIFSAGVDLLRATAGGADYLRSFLPALSRAFETIFFFPKPVVAAINGHAIAGGCVLACATDRRLMASGTARIGVTELLVGVPFPAVALEVMRMCVAPHRFSEAILTGATYTANDAGDRGFIDEIVAPDALMGRARDTAQALTAIGADAFAITKAHIRMPARDRLRTAGGDIDKIVNDIWLRSETIEKMRAYVSRTFKKG
jgi:enoyl-CoA hydratase